MIKQKIFIFYFFILTTMYASNENWIVVTTIQHPTFQLKNLSKIPGWKLLVVGDLKTPKDWHLDNCVYLSPEKQLELGYEITTYLPWNHYSRKNIGYLYAIENGAKVIYDTDDDTEPLNGLSPSFSSNKLYDLPTIHSSDICINIYSYFGQNNIWPRGFPLDYILHPAPITIKNSSNCSIGIENGVINGNPDVDAIFRLTSDNFTNFVENKTCAIAKNIFCPFNTQNTFIYKKAFFTLFLPTTVSFRATDIWRSYLTQRLLWEVNQLVAFTGPNAFQLRNEHDLMKDFKDEISCYLESKPLLQSLNNWKNPFPDDIFLAMQNLYKTLIDQNFFKQQELPIIIAWQNDLKKILKNDKN